MYKALFFTLLLAANYGYANSETKVKLMFTIGFTQMDERYNYVKSILNTAAKNFGRTVDLIPSISGREIFFALDAQADGISATVDQQYWHYKPDDIAQLKDPFMVARNIAIAKEGVKLPTTWQALNESGLVIVIVRHHYSAKAFLKDAAIIEVETVKQALEVFEANRADILVAFETGYEVTQHPMLASINVQPFTTLSYRTLYTFIRTTLGIEPDAFSNAIQKAMKDNPYPGQDDVRRLASNIAK